MMMTAHPEMYTKATILLTIVGKFDRLSICDLERMKAQLRRVEENHKNENEQLRDAYLTRMIDGKIEERNAKDKLGKQRAENIELRKMLETHIELQHKHVELHNKYNAVYNAAIKRSEQESSEQESSDQEPQTKRARV